MFYAVMYNLNRPGQDYRSITDVIKRYDHVYMGGSNWLIKSNRLSSQIYAHLVQRLDPNDELFVCPFHQCYHTNNLPPEVRSFLRR